MHCTHCGYQLTDFEATCPECGRNEVGIPQRTAVASVLAAIGRPFALRAWPRHAWTRSSAPCAALLTLPLAALLLATIVDVGSRVRWGFAAIPIGAGSFAVGVEGLSWSLLRPVPDFHVLAPTALIPGSTGVVWDSGFDFSVEHRVMRMAAIVLTPVVTWLLLRWVIAPVSLRRTGNRLDASERRAAREAFGVLCAAIPLATSLFILVALAAVAALQLLDPMAAIRWGGRASQLGGLIYGCGLIGVPIFSWWLAMRGDRGHVIFPAPWGSLALVSLAVVASPVIAAGLVSLGSFIILLQGL